MVKVYGPMMSFGASGTLGKVATFSNWKGRAYVRNRVIPANPQSVGQLSVRAMMKFLSQYWASLTSPQQTDWQDRADAAVVSPFNAYMSYNQRRWGNNLRPSKLDPATSNNTPGTISAFTATAGSRSVLVSVTISSHDDNWGVAIFRGDAADMGVSRNELVQVIPAEATATFTWLDTPLTPNVAVYYRCYPFDDTGLIGVAEDDITATPTA